MIFDSTFNIQYEGNPLDAEFGGNVTCKRDGHPEQRFRHYTTAADGTRVKTTRVLFKQGQVEQEVPIIYAPSAQAAMGAAMKVMIDRVVALGETKEPSGHTPAPWVVETSDASDPTVTVKQGGPHWEGPIVADMWPTPGDGTNDAEVVLANARLIAAAPDLLAECQRMVECWDEGNENAMQDAYERMLAAIEKATGGYGDV